jgi:hypothetical protein
LALITPFPAVSPLEQGAVAPTSSGLMEITVSPISVRDTMGQKSGRLSDLQVPFAATCAAPTPSGLMEITFSSISMSDNMEDSAVLPTSSRLMEIMGPPVSARDNVGQDLGTIPSSVRVMEITVSNQHEG